MHSIHSMHNYRLPYYPHAPRPTTRTCSPSAVLKSCPSLAPNRPASIAAPKPPPPPAEEEDDDDDDGGSAAHSPMEDRRQEREESLDNLAWKERHSPHTLGSTPGLAVECCVDALCGSFDSEEGSFCIFLFHCLGEGVSGVCVFLGECL